MASLLKLTLFVVFPLVCCNSTPSKLHFFTFPIPTFLHQLLEITLKVMTRVQFN